MCSPHFLFTLERFNFEKGEGDAVPPGPKKAKKHAFFVK